MYHLIMEEPFNDYSALFVRPEDFETQLDKLNEAGYSYMFASEYHNTNVPSVILTFDDGYEDNYTTMFPILKAHHAKATIFLISGLLNTDGYLTTEQVKEMAASGYVYFGSHTRSHLDLRNLSEDNVREQFESSISAIEAITGQKVTAMAYPGGGFNDTVASIASDYFDFCYTTKSPHSYTNVTDYTIPRFYVSRSIGSNILSLIS